MKRTQITQQLRVSIDKGDWVKLISFHTANEMVAWLKRQHRMGENLC
jgi:hypothetical protein